MIMRIEELTWKTLRFEKKGNQKPSQQKLISPLEQLAS